MGEAEDKKKPQGKKGKNGRDKTKHQGLFSKEMQPLSPAHEEGLLLPKRAPRTDLIRATKKESEAAALERQKKRGRKGLVLGSKVRMGGSEFSFQRLRAYGLNSKRLYYRQLLRKKAWKKHSKSPRETQLSKEHTVTQS